MLAWLQHGVKLPFIRGPPPRFNMGTSLLDATPEQQKFLDYEKARLLQSGAWEPASDSGWVSRVFLAPKPGYTE